MIKQEFINKQLEENNYLVAKPVLLSQRRKMQIEMQALRLF